MIGMSGNDGLQAASRTLRLFIVTIKLEDGYQGLPRIGCPDPSPPNVASCTGKVFSATV